MLYNVPEFQMDTIPEPESWQTVCEWLDAVIKWEHWKRNLLRSMRVRRHKKKRIDKKWEKRYGYKN